MTSKPANLNFSLGAAETLESPGKMTDVQMFSNSNINIIDMTTRGSKSCGQPGDYINWKDAEWTLHSKAKIIAMDGAWGPCRRTSKMHVYLMSEWHHQSTCMQHCEKLGGLSPSVRTFEDWEALGEEIQDLPVEFVEFQWQLWLAATEGDKGTHLSSIDYWPEGIEAVERVWRDYYTGDLLDNYTKPWVTKKGDQGFGDNYNCIVQLLLGRVAMCRL